MAIRILIADDNPLVRAAMRQVLECVNKSWEIVEAENGLDTVAEAQEHKPDLIIMDLVMPSMDGLAATRKITKLQPDIPILMHTLYSSPRVALEALKAGVRRVVPKSDSNALVSAVQDLLQPRMPDTLKA